MPAQPTPAYVGELPSSAGGGPVTFLTSQVSFASAADPETPVLRRDKGRVRARIENRGPSAVVIGHTKEGAGGVLLALTNGYLLGPRREFPTVINDALAAVPLGPAVLQVFEETMGP